ncbi:hypothetical protein [Streptomyces sp. YIM 130001]|uniref:hypothetical protein n=1 Tax=Streptomyces sp. YIM 130001 TaxID=2259644 RepID=UPI001968C98B|nr:hypothetical protein [Streptomyces sp. YIM 130001]
MPELPEDPEPEQVDARAELAEPTQEQDLRTAVRRMAEHQAAQRARRDATGLHHDLTETVRGQAGRALTDGSSRTPPRSHPSSTA